MKSLLKARGGKEPVCLLLFISCELPYKNMTWTQIHTAKVTYTRTYVGSKKDIALASFPNVSTIEAKTGTMTHLTCSDTLTYAFGTLRFTFEQDKITSLNTRGQ